VYYLSNPILDYFQEQLSVQVELRNEEYLKDNSDQIKENKNYIDPQVKNNVQLMPMEPKDSGFPLVYGNNSSDELAPASTEGDTKEEVKIKKELDKDQLKELKKDSKVEESILDSKSVEYRLDDGTKVLNKTLVDKFKKVDDKFIPRDLKIKKDKEERYISNTEELNVTYPDNLNEGIKVSVPEGDLTFTPLNINEVKPEVSENKITYKNVWENVDLVYEYQGSILKEYIYINSPIENPTFEFKVDGADLVYSEKYDNVIEANFKEGNLFLDKLSTYANMIGPVDKDVLKQEIFEESNIRVSLDSEWLKGLLEENYPVVIDPVVSKYIEGSRVDYTAYKHGVYSCNYTTCNVNIGSVQHDNQNWYWRTNTNFDLSGLSGKQIVQAYLDVHMSYDGRQNGSTSTNVNVKATWASCSGYNCVGGSGAPTPSATMTTDGSIDVKTLIQWMVDNNKLGDNIMLYGDEGGSYTYKGLNPYNMSIWIQYNTLPPNNTSVAYPADNQVVTNVYQVLKINPASPDADGDELKYNFVLYSSSGTIVQQSGYSSSVSMPISEGILNDEQTYTWKVFTTDGYYTNSTPTYTFKVDTRISKDITQSYDEAGPLAVSLANGNAYTTNSSHSMNALGGNIGIGLEYNSPFLSKEGLTAKYWNSNNFNGNPVYTRIEPNIDYDWSTASPVANVVPSNDFSASWEGYFVAQTTGNYKFGTDGDDNVWLYGNGSLLYNKNCCGQQWSSNVYLTEGQVYPIRIDFVELSGGAKLTFKVELPNATQMVVPSSYLRTAPAESGFNRGLTGKYYIDSGNHDFTTNQSRFLMRNEPVVDFQWDAGGPSPASGAPSDNFLVRYEGYITAPITGTYKFVTNSDDGVKLTVNGNEIINNWTSHAATLNQSGNVTLTKDQSVKIKLEYYEQSGFATVQLKWNGPVTSNMNQDSAIVIENKYLSPEANVLPVGWKLTLDPNGNIPFEALKVRTNGDVVMTTSGGTESLYTYINGGYKPPVNQDGWLIKNSDSTYTFTDVAGSIYIYDVLDNSGFYRLKESSSPYDDKNPAGLKYEYSDIGGGVIKLRKIVDGVDSSRYGKLYYQGDTECSPGSGDNAVPAGYLCSFYTTDGRWTQFNYYKGFLSRIAFPGDAYFDYGYLTDGRITSLRDVGMTDAIIAGLRNSSEQGSAYNFAYDQLGRMNNVMFPSNSGNSNIQHTFDYFPTSSKQHIVGATEPNNYSKYLEFDNKYRTTKLCDAMALCTLTEWDTNKDLVLSTTGPTGMKSTTIYDGDDKPIEQYGPAPTAWFGSDRKPLSTYVNQVPKVETKYEENMNGGSVAFYQVKSSSSTSASLFGSPKLHQFGISKTNPSIVAFDYTNQTFPIIKDSGMDGVGLSMSGKITFPQNGTYTFKSVSTDGVKVFVNDSLIVDSWSNRSSTTVQTTGTFSATANTVYRVRVDWATFNTTPKLSVLLSGPGITESNTWSYLKPGFNLPTTNIVYDQQIGNIETKTTYQDPAYGLVSNQVLDLNGLNYTSSSTNEPQVGGYFRQLSKTSAGGSTTYYNYYGVNEQTDNVCTVANDAVSQAGFVRSKLEPSVLSRDVNVINNPSFEIANGTTPSGWYTDNYGTNTATFEYANVGYSGSRSAHVSITSYTSGDSKWVNQENSVKSDTSYTYKEYYKSTTGSDVLLRFTTTPNTYIWMWLGHLNSSGNAWTSFQYNVTSPVGATAVSVYHVLNAVGDLWIDDVSVAEISPYNMVVNPSVELATNNNPNNWYTNSWGTNTAVFNYSTTAQEGSKSLQVTVSNYTNGEAKWSPDEIPVVAGNIYTFSNYYKSTVNTVMIVGYKINGNYQYSDLATIPANSNWTKYQVNVTPPANATAVNFLHAIRANGQLWVDNYSFTKAAPQNLVNNPSMESATNNNPNNWYSNSWGTNTSTFTYENGGVDGTKDLHVSVTGYSSGEAKWFPYEVSVSAGKRYTFTSSYKSTTPSTMVIAYKSGSTYTYEQLAMVPASSNWNTYTTTITIPSGVNAINFLHMLKSNGDLWIDNYSVKETDSNYTEGIATEVIYDSTGRVVANRINKEYWNCTNFDSRGRVSSKVIATNNGKTGKTVSNNFAYGNNPLKRLVTDGTTTVISEYDFVGNLVKYTDSNGMVTTYTYDNLNRLITKVSDIGTEEWTYNNYNQIASKKLNTVVYANVSYDSYGRVSSITYPQANQLAYTGTVRDALDRPIKYNWVQSDGTVLSEELTKSQSGLVTAQKFTLGSAVYNQTYTFDKADRLIAADYGDRQYAYNYSTAANCNFQNSNKNFNRTSDSVTLSGVTTTNNYCYDNADRLVSSTQYGTPTYDSRGNTTKLGNLTFTYDILDQNIGVSETEKSIAYTRDVMGRIINSNYNSGTEVKKYNFASNSSSPDILKDGSNNIIEKYVSLPGLILTMKTVGADYSIMSSTGNVLANNTGTLKRYDPFGSSITLNDKLGFGGSQIRETEKRFGIEFIQMGARVYVPNLGRFLQKDPIDGGNLNTFIYPLDTINSNDFSGKIAPIVIAVAILVIEIIDLVATTSDGVACNNGDQTACDYVALGMTMNTLPGPSPVWFEKSYNSLFNKNVNKLSSKLDEIEDVLVYIGKNSEDEIKYVGITNNFERRVAEHLASDTARSSLSYSVKASFPTRNAARIAEQTLINTYGMAKSGGQLYNKINSIAPPKWANCGILMSCR